MRAAQPCLKWAGGKRQLVPTLLEIFPAKIDRYFEPFFGGGAVFWALAEVGRFRAAHLSDVNDELVNLYTQIRDGVEAIINELSVEEWRNEEAAHYAIRSLDPASLSRVMRAARTIYLNKTCFNGLFRLNSKGGFNVPFGKRKKVEICDAEGLRACARALAGATFDTRDFSAVVDLARPGDLVYLDPPYVPASATANFVGYAAGGFGEKDHERCAEAFRALAEKGVVVVLSNNDTPRVRELYRGFPLREVSVRRAVGASAETRKAAPEVIVLGGPLAGGTKKAKKPAAPKKAPAASASALALPAVDPRQLDLFAETGT